MAASQKELPAAEKQALDALWALHVYGLRAPVGPLWPKALDPPGGSGTGEGRYAVDDFAAYAGQTAKECAKALGGLRDKGLLTFGDLGVGLTVKGALAAVRGGLYGG